ncbi:hypothetical protein HN51_019409, partial [Arachis hypogaea]
MRVIACLILRFELMNNLMIKLLMICYKRKLNDSYSRQVVRDVSVDRIIYFSDLACIENTRIDRRTFHALCNMLKGLGRLEPSKNMGVEEMVAIFLHIITHGIKIRVIKRQFVRSEKIISRQFNDNCLGALDGIHIKVNVIEFDKPRYRNRIGDITTNLLGVVALDMKFIYVLAGWEGSVANSS